MDNWDNYKTAPIEQFHSEAMKEFHQGAEYSANETFIEGMRYINGIEFNRLLANFKRKIMEEYRISNKAIKRTENG